MRIEISDGIFFIGSGLIVGGSYLQNPTLAIIVSGLLLVLISFLVELR